MKTNFFSPLSFVAVFGSGVAKNQDPGSRINIRDRSSGMGKTQIRDPGRTFRIFFEALASVFWVFLKFLNSIVDPDRGWKKVGSGISIPDPQHFLAVLRIRDAYLGS
jgi:hypothetical protein